MNLKRIAKTLTSIFVFLIFLLSVGKCQAGFGVSPPWVRNYNLLPGSRFEQTISLSRGDPVSSLRAKVSLELPDTIKDWITIKEGLDFPLPKGEVSVPMTVVVEVPANAELRKYQGTIKVDAMPEGAEPGVAVVLAAGIEVDLEITEREVEGMIIRYIDIIKTEEGLPISFLMKIENTGNVRTRPDRVYIEVFDQYHKELLATSEDKDLDWIPPFTTKGIVAKFPVKLGLGAYLAEIKIFKGDEILREGNIAFEVVERKPTVPLFSPQAKRNLYRAGAVLLGAIILAVWVIIRKKKGKKVLPVPKRIKIGNIEIKITDTEEKNKKKE